MLEGSCEGLVTCDVLWCVVWAHVVHFELVDLEA